MKRLAVHRPGVIAVFGGTFDPPHRGHVRAAEAVRDRMGVDAVWLVPARIPPHRGAPVLAPEERFELVEAAVRGRERLVASRVELEREGPSFTLDTLDALAARRPRPPTGEASLLFVVGSDAFAEIRAWSRHEELLERHPVLVHPRAGCPLAVALESLPERFRAFVTDDPGTRLIPPRVFTMDVRLPGPESHRIRERLRASEPISAMVPESVARRIAERGYYR